MTVRPLGESDRPAVFQIARICFNVPGEWIRNVGPELRLDRYLGAEENGRLVGIAADFDLTQWIHGRGLRCSGVASVAVLPEFRAAGHASRLVEAMLRRGQSTGFPLSALYPATTRVYRGLGYELAGLRTQFRLPVAEIPASLPVAADVQVSESGMADLAEIQRCYGTFAARHTGPVSSTDEDWWRRRVFRLWSDAPVRAVAARRRGSAAIEGYAAFQLDATPGTWSYDLSCSHFVALTAEAAAALLGYFRGFRGLGRTLTWFGPPGEPLAVWLARGADDVAPIRAQRFMVRLVNVKAALEGRGWPPIEAEIRFAVRDRLFAGNDGPWRLRLSDGQGRLERLDGDPAVPTTFSIGALSALFTGYLTAREAASLGFLEETDPQLAEIGRIFSGPAPWMPDIF